MAWIESHQDLGQHPKTMALATALDGRITTAVGVLTLIWHFTLKFAWRDGDLSKFKPHVIAAAIGVDDGDLLIKALQESGWLDGMTIHDWMDYAGKIVSDRLYNEKRKRRKTPNNGVTSRKTAATLPNPTLPNQPNTKKDQDMRQRRSVFVRPSVEQIGEYCAERRNGMNAQLFFDYYESNGWRVGKNHMKDWMATVRTWERNNFDRGGNNVNGNTRPGSLHDRLLARESKPAGRPAQNMSIVSGGMEFPAAMPILK